MSLPDSLITDLNQLIDNRQVATGIVIAAVVGVGGALYRLLDRYVRHRRTVSVTTVFDQAVNIATPNVTITATGAWSASPGPASAALPAQGDPVESMVILRIANSGTERIELKSKEDDRFSIIFPGRTIRVIKVREPEELAGEPGRHLRPDRFNDFRNLITTTTCLLPDPTTGTIDPSKLTVPNNIVLYWREAFQLAIFLSGKARDPAEKMVVRGELLRGKVIHQTNSRWRHVWLTALPVIPAVALAVAFGVGALTANRALTPQATCVGDLPLNIEGSTAFTHVVTEAAADYEQKCLASRITITADGSDAAIDNHRGGPLANDTLLMVDYSGQAVPTTWKPNPVGMVIFGVVANEGYAATVAGTPYALRDGYAPADLANLYQVASTGTAVPFVAAGRSGGSGTAASFDSWSGLNPSVLTKAHGCPDISATATTPTTALTGVCDVGTTQKMLDFVNDNANAIGFADIDEVTQYPNLTVLPIGGVQPDRANVLSGTYRFAQPEFLYTSGSPSAQVSAFLSFLQSPAETAQLSAQDSGFIPCGDLSGAVAGDCTVTR